MKNIATSIALTIVLLAFSGTTFAQEEKQDTVRTNQDAIYNRPFINIGKTRTAVGGYLEGNTNYFSEDGISEGFSMEMRRFNIFLYSQVGSRIRFLSELEFEHGTEEISIETAIVDFELNPAFNLRMGILMPSIGLVNVNHDSPNWEFVDRPLTSTSIIPTTLSEVGFGVYGKFYPNDNLVLSYDAYLVNGLQDGVILNSEGRTNFESGKAEEMFGEDNNGLPMLNGRTSLTHRKIGEIGLSYYGGVYNTFRLEGEEVEERRSLSMLTVDFNANIKKLNIKGEGVMATVDVPDDIQEIYGEEQTGIFVDFIYPVLQRSMFKWEKAVLNAAVRFEYADYNKGNLTTNVNTNIADDNMGIAFALGFRPRPGTVIRFNYRRHFINDHLGNPTINLAGFQFGFASYF